MRDTLRMIVWVLLGLTIMAYLQGCKQGGELQFGDLATPKLGIDEAVTPPPGDFADQPVDLQTPPVEARIPTALNFEPVATVYTVAGFPDDTDSTVLFCLDGSKDGAAGFVAKLREAATVKKFMDDLEIRLGINLETLQFRAMFECAPLADKKCGMKRMILRAVALDGVESDLFKTMPFDTTGLEVLDISGVNAYKKDDIFYAAVNNALIVASDADVIKAAILKFDSIRFPEIPADSIAFLSVRVPKDSLEKFDFLKVPAPMNAANQKLVALFKLSADGKPEVDVKMLVDNKVWAATMLRLDTDMIDWEKLILKLKGGEDKVNASPMLSKEPLQTPMNVPTYNYNAK